MPMGLIAFAHSDRRFAVIIGDRYSEGRCWSPLSWEPSAATRIADGERTRRAHAQCCEYAEDEHPN